FDIARGVRTRFTVDRGDDRVPVWSHDGSRIAFSSSPDGRNLGLYQKDSGGAGAVEPLLSVQGLDAFAESWSPDGRYLLYATLQNANVETSDIWVLPLFGDRKPYPFAKTPFQEFRSQFSPDGRWVAYVSNESGRLEVYVAPFPPTGAKTLVSNAGGTDPRWHPDGKELYYRTDSNKLMAAAVKASGDRFEVAGVQPLFDLRPPPLDPAVYDVSRD